MAVTRLLESLRPQRAAHERNRAALGAVAYPDALAADFGPRRCREARAEIEAWRGYAPTPLRALPGLAEAAGVSAIDYKDEGLRFGLRSFKALGGAYAVLRVLARELTRTLGAEPATSDIRAGHYRESTRELTVLTATDGNHGRSVAWGAQRFGCRCRIYMHEHVSETRADAVRAYGAQVVRVAGTYDDAVRRAAADADAHGWHAVADTGWEGYADVPREVMAGYALLMTEALEQLPAQQRPTHVFVQGGVGGLAAAVTAVLWMELGANRPRIVVVEPERAPCLFRSARRGRAVRVPVTQETLMAGLSCGEPSLVAWPILAAGADHFLTLGDEAVAPAMRLLAEAPFGDTPVVAGESGVAGLIGLIAARVDGRLAASLRLDARSRVLLIGTEGATDAGIYRRLTGLDPDSVRGEA